MRISTKGRYGFRTLLDIAMHQQRGAVTLSDIAKRQGISVKYLWQVINPLKTAGLLRVLRGSKGGYMLARRPEEITLLDIVTILEGELMLVDCLEKKSGCGQNNNACVARAVWLSVNREMEKVMKGIILSDVLKHCEASSGVVNYMI